MIKNFLISEKEFISIMKSCLNKNNKKITTVENRINIALAGNPNVGKSVIFNQLTGLSQTIGNWPGKTVERMEGHLKFLGHYINIVDLPGIYSLSTYSLEEIVSREYIASDELDIIINVVDATNLERNLFLTFQLLELKIPIIIAVNQMDILRKRNKEINFEYFESIFKVPVIPVVAVHGIGVHQLLEEAIELIYQQEFHPHQKEHKLKSRTHHHQSFKMKQVYEQLKSQSSFKKIFNFPDLSSLLSFGKEVEEKIELLTTSLENKTENMVKNQYPSRFLALKIIENDKEIKNLILEEGHYSEIIKISGEYRKELEDYHGEDISTIISSEIYLNINKILDEILIIKSKKDTKKETLTDMFDHITTHSIWGYVILALILIGIYLFTFIIGDFVGGKIDELYVNLSININTDSIIAKILWEGALGGFFSAVGSVLVYVIPFFLMIEILQDSGYLPRAAFLLDKFMHVLGVHGKTIITMILGFGCNVPACAGCRIMETEREKKISVALTSLVPCAATMVVVMGLVGEYLGLGYVGILFIINFLVIILVGRILNKTMPGECTELIMEMHEYRKPNTKVIMKQTWKRSREFILKSLPIIIIIGISLEVMYIFSLLDPVNFILSPITVFCLGLPAVTGVFLIYGILRKELTFALLEVLAISIGVGSVSFLLSPIQMFVFSLVTMLYIPCFTTIIMIAKQTNWKYALQISLLEITIAIIIGTLINWGYVLIISV
ncbi:MAG: ferrous iron transport protein B [Candidatus Lokiarchaeota archaeon]|nr:ferrous iron transport protein B [Candidatus Lokiarchaeota archaeon]